MALWIDNPIVLFETDKLKYYIPGPHLTWEEQANSLVRFMIYLSLILYLYYNNPMALVIPPLLMMAIQYHYHQRGQLSQAMIGLFQGQVSTAKTTEQTEEEVKEGFTQPLHLRNPYLEDAKKTMIERQAMELDEKEKEILDQMNADLGKQDQPYRVHEIECKVPTIDNPFGNSMPFDTVERQTTPVCPNEFAKDQKFYGKLFNNVDDLFDRNNSQREFTTNPASTRINDREAAIQFFYNTPYTEN